MRLDANAGIFRELAIERKDEALTLSNIPYATAQVTQIEALAQRALERQCIPCVGKQPEITVIKNFLHELKSMREIVGKLLWLLQATRSDISLATCQIAQYIALWDARSAVNLEQL